MIAPTGARRTPQDHVNLPVTIPQIVEETLNCIQAGADKLHLHVRDDDGNHSLDPDLYRQAIGALRQNAPDLPIQITTESAGVYTPKQQLEVLLDLKPQMASISVREVGKDPSVAFTLYKACLNMGTEVQHIIYGLADLQQWVRWREEGVVHPDQSHVIFVVGQYQPERLASVEELNQFIDAKPNDLKSWTVCAFGKTEQDVLLHAAKAGANLRIGFENNIHRPDGTLASCNAENVAALVNALNSLGAP